VRWINRTFEALHPIAFLDEAEGDAVLFRAIEELIGRDERRLAFAHIGPDHATVFLHRISGVAHLVAELLVLGLGGLIDALAVYIEEPAVIKATQPTILDAAIGKIGRAVRAVQADQAETILVVTEEHKILAQDADRHGCAADRHFLYRGDRLPIAAQQFATGCAGTGLRDQIVLLFR
jgi:hypothetical protein